MEEVTEEMKEVKIENKPKETKADAADEVMEPRLYD